MCCTEKSLNHQVLINIIEVVGISHLFNCKVRHCGLENDLRLERYYTQNEWGHETMTKSSWKNAKIKI